MTPSPVHMLTLLTMLWPFRKTFLDHDADWRIIQPVRNAEDELCHLEDSTGQEDGDKPQQEIRYRHSQPVTDDDDDDDELPDILLADDKRTKGAMLHIIGAKVKQEEIEEVREEGERGEGPIHIHMYK